MYDTDMYGFLIDNIPSIERMLKSCGCKQITSNKMGSYKPVNIGIRSYYSVSYGTLSGFNGDSKKSIRIMLGVERGTKRVFIVIKKADLGDLYINGITINRRYADNDYFVDVNKDMSISQIEDIITDKIKEIKEEINSQWEKQDKLILSFMESVNNRFDLVTKEVRKGLENIGCKDIVTNKDKFVELTKDNKKTELSYGFETPESKLYMELILSIYLQDYDIRERRSYINAKIHFSPIWIEDADKITLDNIDQLKDKLETYSCNAFISSDSDVERGVQDILESIKTKDSLAKKNLDLFNKMSSGDLSVKSSDVKQLTNVLSELPNLFVKAVQKTDVSELDKGEKAYYNNLMRIKKEYDLGNYESLDDLYSMFKFCYDEIHRKLGNLQNKKGVRDQYNALFNLMFYSLGETWQKIAKMFNNTSIWSLS